MAVLMMTTSWEDQCSNGETGHSNGLMLGLVLVAYYALVFLIGRIMLSRCGERWGWYFVAMIALLVLAPPVALFWLALA